MRTTNNVTSLLLPLLIFLCSCHSGPPTDQQGISTDTAVIASGKALFGQYCAGCHNFRQNGIGPKLNGITTEVPVTWLRHFIADPQQAIASGDKRASTLFDTYKTIMPSFTMLKEEDINALIAFLNTHQTSARQKVTDTSQAIADPIPAMIKHSGLMVNLQEITQFPATSDSGKHPLARITKLDFQPNTGALFVDDLRGKLYTLKNGKPAVFMDFLKLRPKFVHEPGLGAGLGSFAFHPDFAKNGLLYTTHTEPPQFEKADFRYDDSIETKVQWVLTEWKVSDPKADTFSGTSRELFRANMVSVIHGIQEITFNPLAKPGSDDYGMLYIGVGDGGSVENGYPSIPHSKQRIWGAILRINTTGSNSANGKYGIPPGNPFVHEGNALGEIYAYGFRNPHRISWSKSGMMLVCNIGQHHIESVNLVHPGSDFGWPTREGSFVIHPEGDIDNVYPLPENDSVYHITYPVAAYDHDDGVAISGGLEYWGKSIPLLEGKYFFGDIMSGRLFYVNISDIKQGSSAPLQEWGVKINGVAKTLVEACGIKRVDLHFGRDAQGDLYLLTKADGRLYKMVGATLNP